MFEELIEQTHKEINKMRAKQSLAPYPFAPKPKGPIPHYIPLKDILEMSQYSETPCKCGKPGCFLTVGQEKMGRFYNYGHKEQLARKVPEIFQKVYGTNGTPPPVTKQPTAEELCMRALAQLDKEHQQARDQVTILNLRIRDLMSDRFKLEDQIDKLRRAGETLRDIFVPEAKLSGIAQVEGFSETFDLDKPISASSPIADHSCRTLDHAPTFAPGQELAGSASGEV
jgi:hypothetical protein